MDGIGNAVLYGSDDSRESSAMVELLKELAMREWEQLDGERVPLLRLGNNSIVRGFDRIKVQQLVGWVGC